MNSSSSENVDIRLSLRALQLVLPTLSPSNGPSHAHVTWVVLLGIGWHVEVKHNAYVPTQKLSPSMVADSAGVARTRIGMNDLSIFAVVISNGSDCEVVKNN